MRRTSARCCSSAVAASCCHNHPYLGLMVSWSTNELTGQMSWGSRDQLIKLVSYHYGSGGHPYFGEGGSRPVLFSPDLPAAIECHRNSDGCHDILRF